MADKACGYVVAAATWRSHAAAVVRREHVMGLRDREHASRELPPAPTGTETLSPSAPISICMSRVLPIARMVKLMVPIRQRARPLLWRSPKPCSCETDSARQILCSTAMQCRGMALMQALPFVALIL